MITEYVKGNPATIYDTNRGLYQRDYYNNLENIIQKENEIEIIKDQMKKIEENINLKQENIFLDYHFWSFTRFGTFIVTLFFIMIFFLFTTLDLWMRVTSYMVLIVMDAFVNKLISHFSQKRHKKIMTEINNLTRVIPELIKEKQEKETELLKMKQESVKQEVVEEKINMASFNQTYRQELEDKLSELINQKEIEKSSSLKLSYPKN